jgi:hypothetical protein
MLAKMPIIIHITPLPSMAKEWLKSDQMMAQSALVPEQHLG